MAAASLLFAVTACEDDTSLIGGEIRPNDVSITVDSAAFDISGRTVDAPALDGRSTSTMLGAIRTPEYGALRCSYVTQLLPAKNLTIPDSIKSADIDSVRLILNFPISSITGDSLSPQQVSVFRLSEKLPSNLGADYNPSGKYFSKPMGVRNYTLSSITMGEETVTVTNTQTDTKIKQISLRVPFPVEFGRKAVEQYRTDPSIFEWPAKFANEFYGLYVESSFGKGCVATVSRSSVFIYSKHKELVSVTDDEGHTTAKYVDVKDSTCLFTSAPEVLSSNIISYEPSDALKARVKAGDAIISTPGGYAVEFTFPAARLLERFWNSTSNLGVVNDATFAIPGEKIANPHGIGVPPALLMVKTSQLADFFSQGKLPDKVDSFIGVWSAEKGRYDFGSVREYVEGLRKKGEENLTDDDQEFSLIPVMYATEDITLEDGTKKTVYTTCVPYLWMPTMTRLLTDKAQIVFTYSNQTIF